MSDDGRGQLFSLLAALAWSSGLVLFRLSSTSIQPIALNLFKNVVALILFALTLFLAPGTLAAAQLFTPSEWLVLAISGVFGIALADTIFFWALQRLGVGLIAIVDCAYSPIVVMFAWFMLGEELTALQMTGGTLILSAVCVASLGKQNTITTGPAIWVAVAAAILAVTLMAYGIVLATPVLRAHANTPSLLVMTTIRLLAGTLALALLTPLTSERQTAWKVLLPSRVWKLSIPAATLGTFICLIFWVSGFTYTAAGVAALLNQTSLIWSMLLASLLLREPFTRNRMLAVALAMLGIVLVSWRTITGGV